MNKNKVFEFRKTQPTDMGTSFPIIVTNKIDDDRVYGRFDFDNMSTTKKVIASTYLKSCV